MSCADGWIDEHPVRPMRLIFFFLFELHRATSPALNNREQFEERPHGQ
jgi:hypothetical protein